MKMGEAPDPELTSRMQKPCLKSPHPSVHICNKRPETKFARKVHRQIKALSKRLQKKQITREERQKRWREIRRREKAEGGYWRKRKLIRREGEKKKTNKKRRRIKKSRKGNRKG